MTNLELQTAIRDDLSIETGDIFYSDAYIQRIINRSVKWFAGLHQWQQTQLAYYRNSIAGQEYYNYPERFKTDTIWKLSFNGEDYDRTTFSEYLKYQEDNGVPNDELFSDFRRQFFINPAPTSISEITVWGHLVPEDMSADADTHAFSGETDPEEVILKYALGLALKKGRGSLYSKGVEEISAAKSIAKSIWKKQKQEQSKYKTKDVVMFDYVNILPVNGGERRTQNGSFETC